MLKGKQQGSKKIQWEKNNILKNRGGKTGQPHAKKNEIGHLPHITYKN